MKRFLILIFIIIVCFTFAFSSVGVFYSETAKNFYTESVYNTILNGLYEALDFGKIDYTVLKIQELSEGIPEDIDVLILPSNAALKEAELEMIEKFILRGGRIFGAYEDGLRYSDGKIRPNYAFGSYLGIKYKGWRKGGFNYIKFSEKAKEIFGNDLPEYLKMPRGFTFTFSVEDAQCLGVWTKDMRGNLSTDSEVACAVVLGKAGIFFGENIFLLTSTDDAFKKIIVNGVRYLQGMKPVEIDMVKIKKEKILSYLEKVKDNLKLSEKDLSSEKFIELSNKLREISSKVSEEKLDEEVLEEIKYEISLVEAQLVESEYIQARAIWLDHGAIANTGSPENLRKVIKKLADIGFNILIPEVIYKGVTISPKLSGYKQDDIFSEWKEDPLEVIIEQAHKLGLEVHAWTWIFAVAHGNVESPLMKEHPDWLEKDRFGNIFTPNRTAWLSHANEQARNFVKGQILELIDKYELDGINLDYIRYDGEMGYDEVTIEKFKKETGISPYEIEAFSEEAVKWQMWREELVTSFVKEIYSEIKAKNPNLLVSADVFPRLSGARLNKKQNWDNWAKNHYVDILIPMNYTSNIEDLKIIIEEQKKYKNYVYFYPGIQMISLKKTEDLVKQISTVLSEQFPGITLFSLAYIDKFDLERLKIGYFRNKAVPPHSSLKMVFDYFSKELEEAFSIFEERNLVTLDEKQRFINLWNEIKENLEIKDINQIFRELIYLKRKTPEFFENQKVSLRLVDELYKFMDMLRPRLYENSRFGKEAIPATKPEKMVVVKNPIKIPKMRVDFTKKPIKIDGEIEDTWKLSEWSSNFLVYDTGEEYKYTTKVKVLHDKDNLYVLFDCYEPEMGSIQIESGKRDTRVYLGDSVEVFIWPDESKKEYYHFVISVDGTIYDEINYDSRWNGKIKAATKKLEDRWIVEAKINISDIVSSREFRVNFNRNRWRGKTAEYSGWSCTYGSFHNIERFGYIELLEGE
ncbi:MAG: hypothetical protein PWQ20_693 [Thermotogaceae bacterium]|jgi:uncharacterized lipoprotein YddW (UPF0748 family)|nr:hypothetical protein [Thermotogaceae bacterium]MDN5337623.1 hypothetical protein [Thermotogaceae bacterium]